MSRTKDRIDRAIAASAKPPVELNRFDLTLLGDDARPLVVVVPHDITDVEIIAAMTAMALIGDQLRGQRGIRIARVMPGRES